MPRPERPVIDSPQALATEMRRLRRKLTALLEREFPQTFIKVLFTTGDYPDNTPEQTISGAEGTIEIYLPCSELRKDPRITVEVSGHWPDETEAP
jgi:hypothetical protein